MTKDNNNSKKKQSTDSMIDDAIAKQNAWLENRRTFTRGFLKKIDTFARKNDDKTSVAAQEAQKARARRNTIAAYWFPILCALVVIFIAIWVAFVRGPAPQRVVVVPAIPEPVVKTVDTLTAPAFDIVRIEKDGNIVIAGRWLPHQNISIVVNGQIIATERTNSAGEFVYAPVKPFAPGNYTISLVGTEPTVKSADKVFVFVSEAGAENSVSLLMTRDGSTLLQAPTMLRDGDLSVSKIDYLDSGRIVVTGNSLPRLRVSLSLNDKYLGFARVSDHHHFGLGADVGELESGKEYSLVVRLHDGDGRTVSTVKHDFIMPEMTGDDDTFYTVRRGDCLWIIARNFLRRGILFSIIAERNNIENPDLIYPKQLLQIPVEK